MEKPLMRSLKDSRSGISQTTVFWHILLSFSLFVGGRRRVENREGRAVWRKCVKINVSLFFGEMSKWHKRKS